MKSFFLLHATLSVILLLGSVAGPVSYASAEGEIALLGEPAVAPGDQLVITFENPYK